MSLKVSERTWQYEAGSSADENSEVGGERKYLRDYSKEGDSEVQKRVRSVYQQMHSLQTVQFVRDKMKQWMKFDKFTASVCSTLERLDCVLDESDPDLELPNIVHAYQTAERIRAEYPDNTWFQVTGLIHDLGKIMSLYGEPQYSTVGDTYVLGCRPGNSVVYGSVSFSDNPDMEDSRYNTRYGMYEPNCGLENVLMTWGHDEYLYRVLRHNPCSLPDEALYIIRFHSFYPWHTGGDYLHLCNMKDQRMLAWVREFNRFDLYSKTDEVPDIDKLRPYYHSLIDQYCPGIYHW